MGRGRGRRVGLLLVGSVCKFLGLMESKVGKTFYMIFSCVINHGYQFES